METTGHSAKRSLHKTIRTHIAVGDDEPGATSKAGVQYRHRDLPGMWRGGENHRLHRQSGGDREDTGAPTVKDYPGASKFAAGKPGAAGRPVWLSPPNPSPHCNGSYPKGSQAHRLA